MTRRVADLAVAASVPVAALVTTLAMDPGWTRFVLVALTYFVAPGYVLQDWLMPRSRAASGPLERAGLSIAVSVALAALLVTILNFTPLGVDAVPALATLALMSVAAAAAAARRRAPSAPVPPMRRVPTPRLAAVVGGAALFAVGVGVLVDAPPGLERSHVPFTELALRTENGELGPYPTEIGQGETLVLRPWVRSHEDATHSFVLRGLMDNETFYETEIDLPPGWMWEDMARVPTDEPGDHRIDFVLLKDGVRYRETRLDITVVAP